MEVYALEFDVIKGYYSTHHNIERVVNLYSEKHKFLNDYAQLKCKSWVHNISAYSSSMDRIDMEELIRN